MISVSKFGHSLADVVRRVGVRRTGTLHPVVLNPHTVAISLTPSRSARPGPENSRPRLAEDPD